MNEIEEQIKNVKAVANAIGKVEWEVTFTMGEHPTSRRGSNQQREITHTIARAIASIPSQFKELTVADYHIVRAGKEQPEADALHTRWGGDKKTR